VKIAWVSSAEIFTIFAVLTCCLFDVLVIYSVNTLNAECPQFQTFKECVDLNDFNTHKCRKYEKPVYDFWNAKMGYSAQAQDGAGSEKSPSSH
jgi:hypothetical protein